jgi:hypothetical protein
MLICQISEESNLQDRAIEIDKRSSLCPCIPLPVTEWDLLARQCGCGEFHGEGILPGIQKILTDATNIEIKK